MFREVGKDPYSWLYSAKALMRAARSLLPTMEAGRRRLDDPTPAASFEAPVTPIYMLLFGLAIENLAKGIQVARKLPDKLKTHKTIELLEDLHLSVTPAEAYLLERVETFVLWAGRYPIPLNPDDFLPRSNPEGGSGPLNCVTSADFEMLEALASRLK
ncbi:MAG: hypothetical protein AAB037_03295, partial [Chloroflexota bacterium]